MLGSSVEIEPHIIPLSIGLFLSSLRLYSPEDG